MTVVICPIIALIESQRKELEGIGVTVGTIQDKAKMCASEVAGKHEQ